MCPLISEEMLIPCVQSDFSVDDVMTRLITVN